MNDKAVTYLTSSSSPEDWRPLLADPEKHWVRGRSAWELAYSWESAKGFPDPVRSVLDGSNVHALGGLSVVKAHPELPTALPGGSRPSYTDLWILASNRHGTVSVGVEGKVDETFGPLVSDWDPDGSPGRRERIGFLCDLLGFEVENVLDLRYQLLHRTAASILEAQRHGCETSVMLVHSFATDHAWFDDYSMFIERLGGAPEINGVTGIGPDRYVGWVADSPLPIETD